MFSGSPAWLAPRRCQNDPICLYVICHHLNCQFLSKNQRRIRFLVPCTRPTLPGIHLRDLQFDHHFVSHVFSSPMLTFVVPAEGFHITEALPLTIHTPPGRVPFHLVEGPVHQHDFCYVFIVLAAMNEKRNAPKSRTNDLTSPNSFLDMCALI
jgi:hypothetical protein